MMATKEYMASVWGSGFIVLILLFNKNSAVKLEWKAGKKSPYFFLKYLLFTSSIQLHKK